MAGFLDSLIRFGEKLAGAAEPSAKRVKELGDVAVLMVAPTRQVVVLLEQMAESLTDLLGHLTGIPTVQAAPGSAPAPGGAGGPGGPGGAGGAGAAGESGEPAGGTSSGLGGFLTVLQGAVAPGREVVLLLRQMAEALTDLLTHLTGIPTVEAAPKPGEGGAAGAGGLGGAGGTGGEGGAAGEAGGAGLGAMALAGLGGAVTAMQGMIGAIQQVIAMIGQWVECLDPGLMKQFQMTIRDLQATLGHAFTGVFEQLMPVVEQVAGILMPLMEELKPVIDELAQNAIANLIPQVQLLASLFEAILPIFEAFMAVQEAIEAVMRPVILIFRLLFEELGAAFKILMVVLSPVLEALKVFEAVMDGLAEIMDVVITVYKTMAQTLQEFLKGIFGTDLAGTIKKIKEVIHEVIKAYLLFIAQLAKFFGADKFLHNLIENLKPKHGEMAQGSTSIKNIESIAKDMSLAAAQAAGGSGDKKAGLEDVIAAMERIASGEDGLNGQLLETLKAIRDWLEKLGVTEQNVKEAGEKAKQVGKGAAFGGLGGWAWDTFFNR